MQSTSTHQGTGSRSKSLRLVPLCVPNVYEPEPGNNFRDVGIISQSQFSSSSPRTTARGIRCEELSSFILSWYLIDQRETKVITSQKSFPGSGSQTLFSAETSDSRKYVCVRRLSSGSTLRFLKSTGVELNGAHNMVTKYLFCFRITSLS